MSAVVELIKVSKAFGDHLVLDHLDLAVAPGDIIAVLGPSGSGKSTMLRTINGLQPIDSGTVMVEGTPLPGAGADLARLRTKVGMVFQQFNLFPGKTALENVMLGPVQVLKKPIAEADREARELLARVGLADAVDQNADTFSGGQKQRVAIARALAMQPSIMLFDEPTSALDPEMVGEVLEVMEGLAAQGMTMLVVSHEMSFARKVATKIALLAEGRVAELTPTEQFFTEPRTAAGRAFLQHVVRRDEV
ncbi:MAG: amino acid ABC transporter ATP-binding protein [Propionibacteriaceae bacterium]